MNFYTHLYFNYGKIWHIVSIKAVAPPPRAFRYPLADDDPMLHHELLGGFNQRIIVPFLLNIEIFETTMYIKLPSGKLT